MHKKKIIHANVKHALDLFEKKNSLLHTYTVYEKHMHKYIKI